MSEDNCIKDLAQRQGQVKGQTSILSSKIGSQFKYYYLKIKAPEVFKNDTFQELPGGFAPLGPLPGCCPGPTGGPCGLQAPSIFFSIFSFFHFYPCYVHMVSQASVCLHTMLKVVEQTTSTFLMWFFNFNAILYWLTSSEIALSSLICVLSVFISSLYLLTLHV